MIITKTPYRISFFGGGTDLSAWLDNDNDGLILSTSINRYCYITLRNLPKIFDYKYRLRYYENEETNFIKNIKHNSIRACLDTHNFHSKTLELVHHGELPSQSGLGSSSTFTVGLIKGLLEINKKKTSKKNLAQSAIFIEQKKLKESVGIQDHIAASYGGFNIITMKKKNNFKVSNFKNLKIKKIIEDHLLLIFTGLQRNSEPLEKSKSIRIKKRQNDNELNNILDITKSAISEIYSQNFSIKTFGKLLSENWHYKKLMHKSISNIKIDEIYNEVISSGAYGGKLLGSGNGGFFMFLCPKEIKKKLEKNFKNRLINDIKFDEMGSHKIYPS
jgi:D-glycero-alpha-D-manno-heptose-7-phosphate kinase